MISADLETARRHLLNEHCIETSTANTTEGREKLDSCLKLPENKRRWECTRCGQLFLSQPDVSGALQHLAQQHSVTEGDDDARSELLVFACRGCRTRSDTLKELDAHIETCEVKNSGG